MNLLEGESAVSALVERSTIVRLTPVGDFDPAHRQRGTTIAVVSDAESLGQLAECVRVDAASIPTMNALMTPGDLDLNLLSRKALVAFVTYIHPRFVRVNGYTPDVALLNPERLLAWLTARGWEPAPR